MAIVRAGIKHTMLSDSRLRLLETIQFPRHSLMQLEALGPGDPEPLSSTGFFAEDTEWLTFPMRQSAGNHKDPALMTLLWSALDSRGSCCNRRPILW